MEEHPDRAVSWFAVGCYYMCAQQYEAARRYFGKATALDRGFAPAWVAFGHAFAAQDESDQVGGREGGWVLGGWGWGCRCRKGGGGRRLSRCLQCGACLPA